MKEPQVINGKNYEEARRQGLVGDLVITAFCGRSKEDGLKYRKSDVAFNHAIEDCESQIMKEAKRTQSDYVFMREVGYVLGCPQDSGLPVWIHAELGRLRRDDEIKETIKNAFSHS
jgi:hypothetical protein